jgi:DNA-directed RNA polymerase subunit K/omega
MMVGPAMGRFEFVKLSSLRAAQLTRGCVARVPEGHKRTTTAQHEIAAGKVCGVPREPVRIVAQR